MREPTVTRVPSSLPPPTVAPLKVQPVHIGLLTKLNLLAIGLIVATAIGIASLLVYQQVRDDQARLKTQAMTIIAMVAERSASALVQGDKESLIRMSQSLAGDRDIAYIEVLDSQGNPFLSRTFSDATPPAKPARLRPETVSSNVRVADGRRYLELIAPIAPIRKISDAPADAAMSRSEPTSAAAGVRPIGYVRLGMSVNDGLSKLRDSLVGALSIIGTLVGIAILLTLFLTRRLVAPMHMLTGAARAVASGRLDMRVPVKSADEVGMLTQTFNHMIDRLASSQAQVATYQRTLEDKVAQRTKELEIATAQAYKLAQHDILTGLPNRALLNQRLRQIVAQAGRDGQQVACLFLDFDHFKRINDTLGHDAGDHLLQAVAQRLTNAVRESDTVARLGGDEFVIILPGLDAAKATFEIMAVLTRVRESFLASFRLGEQTPTLTCSIGVSLFPIDADDPGELIKQADTAMYAAKDAGRNAYRFFTVDMNTRVQARLQLETDMRRGLMDDEFFLVYQPQIDMSSGRACGVEALLRWRDPQRGIIGPNEFIPIAEESGMIQALGARVLRDACRQVMAWHRSNMLLRLAVNLSVQQLQHDSWLSIVDDALKSSGLAARYLDLEITESVIITHPDKAVATLIRLKQMGVSITVDDFGTGYSSLSYLARLPIQGVKIDQRFVHGLEKNRNDEAITQAIIALSHSMGLRVIAEGVETVAQFEFLRTHGCEEAQGYLISRPLEEPELRAWWIMQDEENRIVGRQVDMWRQNAGD
jgi:diguanylate cyclase (GGDEF)-like protein